MSTNMPKITFTITSEEIREISQRRLGRAQIKKILDFVENDSALWDNIETSIKSAIEQVVD